MLAVIGRVAMQLGFLDTLLVLSILLLFVLYLVGCIDLGCGSVSKYFGKIVFGICVLKVIVALIYSVLRF